MNNFKKLILSYIFYSLSAFGISLSIKANVGVSSFNSLNLAISNASSIKVGTITMIINTIFLLIYMYMTRFSYKSKYVLQLVSLILFGSFINFFTYYILKDLVLRDYLWRIVLIVIGTIISGVSVGMIISYGQITFPLESLCMEYSSRSRFSFARLRYSFDVFSICASIIISTLFSLAFYVREGTIISLFLFTGSINLSKNIYAKKIKLKCESNS